MKNITKIYLFFLFSILLTNVTFGSDPTKCGLGPMIVGDGALGYTSNSSTSWATFTAATTTLLNFIFKNIFCFALLLLSKYVEIVLF